MNPFDGFFHLVVRDRGAIVGYIWNTQDFQVGFGLGKTRR